MSRNSKDFLINNVFEIGSFTVDVKRGVISNNFSTTSVEPKVMLVLLALCEYTHKVVGQEEIFNQVWPNAIFSPNSLRRCIAELRKALNDNDKQIISTHPKIGYSLNCDINIPKQTPASTGKKQSFNVFLGFAFLLLLFVLYGQINERTEPLKLHITEMQPITATDELEDFISLSPKENFIAFTRDENGNGRKVWIKDLTSGSETLVPISASNIRNLAWSPLADALYFVEVTQNGWVIWRTSFDKNFRLITVEKVVENGHSPWISSIRVGHDHIYYIAKMANNLSVVQYAIEDKRSQVLLNSSIAFKPYELIFDDFNQELVVSGQSSHGIAVIKWISTSKNEFGREIETQNLGVNQRFSIELFAGKRAYLLNNGRQLYYLDMVGELTKLDYEHHQFIRFAKPSALNEQIYLVSSQLDTDFYLETEGDEKQEEIVNSNGMDYLPTISPGNNKLSFYSTRYGLPQLFIRDLNTKETSSIFNNESGYLNVDRSVWNQVGDKLLFSAGLNVYVTNMVGINGHNVEKLSIEGSALAWDPANDAILVRKRNEQGNRLLRFHLREQSSEVVADYISGKPFINKNGEIYLITTNAIQTLDDKGNWSVVIYFDDEIERTISHQHAIYLLFKNNANWFHWALDTGLTQTNFFHREDSKIATISDDHSRAIVVTEKRQRDIVRLLYK